MRPAVSAGSSASTATWRVVIAAAIGCMASESLAAATRSARWVSAGGPCSGGAGLAEGLVPPAGARLAVAHPRAGRRSVGRRSRSARVDCRPWPHTGARPPAARSCPRWPPREGQAKPRHPGRRAPARAGPSRPGAPPRDERRGGGRSRQPVSGGPRSGVPGRRSGPGSAHRPPPRCTGVSSAAAASTLRVAA